MCINIIKIKIDIDINNDELLKIIWKHKGKKEVIITELNWFIAKFS
jgi:hypothetical protein